MQDCRILISCNKNVSCNMKKEKKLFFLVLIEIFFETIFNTLQINTTGSTMKFLKWIQPIVLSFIVWIAQPTNKEKKMTSNYNYGHNILRLSGVLTSFYIFYFHFFIYLYFLPQLKQSVWIYSLVPSLPPKIKILSIIAKNSWKIKVYVSTSLMSRVLE